MQEINKISERTCQRCGDTANVKIEFQSRNVLLCYSCEKEFAEEIKQRHLDPDTEEEK